MVWLKKEKSSYNFSKLYQSLMVCLVHRKLLETQEEKQKACNSRSVNTLNWYCCQVVGWFVCESLHFAPRLFPSTSDRNNCTSSSEEEVNQQWKEAGLEWRGDRLILGWLCWSSDITQDKQHPSYWLEAVTVAMILLHCHCSSCPEENWWMDSEY